MSNDLVLRSASYPGDGWRPEQPSVERPARRRLRPAPSPRLSPKRRLLAGRPVAMSALVCTLLCSLVVRPAYADPGITVPDSGARPVPAGPITFPGSVGTDNGTTTTRVATPVIGPFASKVMAEEIAVQMLGEQVKQLQIDVDAAEATARSTEATWRAATARVEELRTKADSVASDAYKAAAGLGPFGDHASDLHKFSILVPGLAGQPGGQEAARDLLRGEQEEQTANDAYKLASTVAQDTRGKFNNLNGSFIQRTADFVALKAQNSVEYAKAVAQTDAYEQSLGGSNLALNQNIDGLQANPLAVQAVNWALSKTANPATGRKAAPYVWGTEGPDTFDCSGLAFWAYGKVGKTVPRVANAMYHGTQAVVATRSSRGDLLLPGDLVFFGTNPSDWHSIYHMGIYIGGGYMVQAPTTGDVVKVSPVSWSRFFGATRIFPAVPKPTTPPQTSTSTSPASTATTSPPASVPPSASPSTTPSTAPSASPTKSATTTTPSTSPAAPAGGQSSTATSSSPAVVKPASVAPSISS